MAVPHHWGVRRADPNPAPAAPLWWDPDAGAPLGGAEVWRDCSRVRAAWSRSADVVIVGGGFTGLWSAYYLLQARPDLDVLVLEAQRVGFGASGRNGGWVSALFPVPADDLARRHGEAAARSLLAALRETVVEVGKVVAAEAMPGVGYHRGGTVALARTPAQVTRAQAGVAAARPWDEGTVWLPAAEARERMAGAGVLGATYNPHCARVQPMALVQGLAAAVRRLGGRIVEGVRVSGAEPGCVHTDSGTVRAAHVLRATEAWTAALTGLRRRVAPVYSLIVATQPLAPSVWKRIGLADFEVFTDHRHEIVYGQRTEDGRLVFGGRGAPYHFGSAIAPRFDADAQVFARLRATLRDLLPQLGDVEFTHAWGGPLGIPRDWHPSVTYDRSVRVGSAGGYVGDGVAAANLAGRTLADLVLGLDTPLTRLPWVGHRSPDWEPEPLRWLGVNAGLRLAALADREEARTGSPARLGRVLAALTGH